MKLLHTADLHLGRILHEQSLIEDQAYMLDQLVSVLARDDYSALLMAGDIYDRTIPPPEAVSLLGAFLRRIRSEFPELAVCMIPGNHDSAERLGFGRELFRELDIHIGSVAEKAAEPLILEKDGERCAVFLLPFLHAGALHREDEEIPLRSQRDLAAFAAERLNKAAAEQKKQGITWTVLMAHLFAIGGMESESERIFLGSAERVDPFLFSSFDYAAFGHLHRSQKAAANAWYSGSPLAYSFDEADHKKSVLSVSLSSSGCTVEALPIQALHQVRRLSGSFSRFFEGPTSSDDGSDFKNDYLELCLDDEGLIENPLALLRQRFPRLLSVRQEKAFSAIRNAAGPEVLPKQQEQRRGASEDFSAFLNELYGSTDEAELELFRSLAEEAEHEAQ